MHFIILPIFLRTASLSSLKIIFKVPELYNESNALFPLVILMLSLGFLVQFRSRQPDKVPSVPVACKILKQFVPKFCLNGIGESRKLSGILEHASRAARELGTTEWTGNRRVSVGAHYRCAVRF